MSLNWRKVEGALTVVSASGNYVWGVNGAFALSHSFLFLLAAGDIWRWNGHGWDKVEGNAVHISVGTDGTVWCLNRSDEIFRWHGSGWEKSK
jgi:hypothetical protein